MKNGWLKVLFILVLLAAAVSTVFAQDLPYLFEIKSEVVHVYWNQNGTTDLDYTWAFKNLAGSHPIDFVDVGTVNSSFSIENVRADVDGTPVFVSWDDYAGNGSGFAIVMGDQAIPAGSGGTVHVFIPGIENILYPDWDDKAYASASFAPTWFGSEFVSGTTDLTVTFHLPPNMKPEEPRWHESPVDFPAKPQTGLDDAGRITYTWHSPSANVSHYYDFGASFPRTYVPAESVYTPPPEPLIHEDVLTLLLLAGCVGSAFIGFPIFASRLAKRRRLEYLSPKISIEGHGIKRGLTAVEAAILMEQPLDKVLTMILFGVIKKGAASVKSRAPLELDIASPAPEDLYQYEKDFLEAFSQPTARVSQDELRGAVIKLVKNVSKKMCGFSRSETIDYYRSIIEKAWKQVEEANTPEVKSQKFDEALEWTMLDKDYNDRTRRVFQEPIFLPAWWGRYDPNYRPASSLPVTGSASPVPGQPSAGSVSSSGGKTLPGADFAASVVNGVQVFASGAIGDIRRFASLVTNATNPLPAPSSSSSSSSRDSDFGGSSGGSSCACACACACAGCACACAGGGR